MCELIAFVLVFIGLPLLFGAIAHQMGRDIDE